MITETSEPVVQVKDGFVFLHCNCAKMMNVGVTKQFREIYPKIFDEYKEALWAYESPGELIGKFKSVQLDKRLWACLCFAQLNVAKFDFDTKPDAYEKIFRSVKRQLTAHIRKTFDDKWMLHVDSRLGNEGGTSFDDDILPIVKTVFEFSDIPVVIHRS